MKAVEKEKAEDPPPTIEELEDKLDTIEGEIRDAVSTLEGIDCDK